MTFQRLRWIIFGYGDATDDDYKKIERLNDNRFFTHIKSINYWRNENYKDYLGFINPDYYQVCIMGDSCELTDKTLLKELFEHEKCVSIKPYYYIKKENKEKSKKEIEDTDYIQIVSNISRLFDNKNEARDKVISFNLCFPMPQK